MLKLDSSVPAGFAPHLPADRVSSLALRGLAALRRWHEHANAAYRLRELDDRLLRDVGLVRHDIDVPPAYRPWD